MLAAWAVGDGQRRMEIHKPKAAHSWREFLVEIGTIVCGIVIALTGEEVLTTLHRQAQGEALRKVLNNELAWNLSNLKDLADAKPCVDQRMEELEQWKRSLKSNRPVKLIHAVISPNYVIFRTSAWRSSQAGAAEELPLAARIAYAQFYDNVESVARSREEAVKSWSEIADFSATQSVTPQEARQISHDIKLIINIYNREFQNYRIWTENYSPPLGVELGDAPQQDLKRRFVTRLDEICTPLIDQSPPLQRRSGTQEGSQAVGWTSADHNPVSER